MSKPIDLGRKLNDIVSISALGPDEAHYPNLSIESDDERLALMPDQGVAEIRYRIRSRTHREEKNGKGKNYSCSLRLEILSISAPEGKKKNSNGYGDDARRSMSDYFKEKK